MPHQLYNKPYCAPHELITYIEDNGLTIHDKLAAEKLLSDINYYRFKVYLRPFLNQANNRYYAGTTFEQGVELYRFDDELRDVLFSFIGRVEVKLRSKLDQLVTSHTQNAFWYLGDDCFSNLRGVASLRNKLSSYFLSSRDDFSTHFKQNYYNNINPEFSRLPPFWMIGELTTFGHISILYSSVNKPIFNDQPQANKLDLLAREFGASNLKQLNSWINFIKDVRNRCAHHSRVWNANYRQPSGIVNLLDIAPAHPNRIYLFIALIHKVSTSLNMGFDARLTLVELFNKHPTAKAKARSAGFPVGWEADPFWQ